ncbi:MAG: NifU family protein [Rhodobacteraceae bacterium]|nr:MAG: NifU family protein [Paracoccaceae bacterium]
MAEAARARGGRGGGAVSAAVRIRAETSPRDPDAARFVLERPVADGAVAFDDAAAAAEAPLPAALFALDGVRRVAFDGPAITVAKAAEADWAALKPAVAAAIRAALPAHDAAPPLRPAQDLDADARMFEAVRKALDGSANPAIAKHGGRVDVVAVENGDVKLRMSGGCQGCAASSATLRDGVERILRAAVPGIGRIVDVTDHAAGENPFFRREGASPLGSAATRDGDGWTVDAGRLAERFGVEPEALRAEMRAGRVASVEERGEGADSGFTRLTVRWGKRLWRAVVGPDGAAREEVGEAADPALAGRVRAYLEAADPARLPVSYGALAEALGVRPPHAIGQVARALETTMREDAAAGRPFVAALVVGRARGGLPAPGFFALAADLGRGPEGDEDARACHARLFAEAMAARTAPAGA